MFSFHRGKWSFKSGSPCPRSHSQWGGGITTPAEGSVRWPSLSALTQDRLSATRWDLPLIIIWKYCSQLARGSMKLEKTQDWESETKPSSSCPASEPTTWSCVQVSVTVLMLTNSLWDQRQVTTHPWAPVSPGRKIIWSRFQRFKMCPTA